MPQIGTQPKQLFTDLDKVREETKRDKEHMEQLRRDIERQIQAKKEIIPQSLEITIIFLRGARKQIPKQVFLSWYDHALRQRVILMPSPVGPFLVPWGGWGLKHRVIYQFSSTLNIRNGLSVLGTALKHGRSYPESISDMLYSIGLKVDFPKKLTVEDLFNYCASSDSFTLTETKVYENKD